MEKEKIAHYKTLLSKDKKSILEEARKELLKRKSGDKDKLKNLEDDAFYESEDLLKQTLSIFKKRKLSEIDHTLSMIVDHTFGHCIECGVEISESRLNAVPYAKLCIYCQDEIERSDMLSADSEPRSYRVLRKEGQFRKNFDESDSDDDLIVNMRIGEDE
ncbi:TraR/DksA family transcriptional regulator [bacterium]|nr:TraR/DksA family transcriptional regulator [bacterium]